MKPVPQRLVIHAKDVQRITGRTIRTAQLMLQRIREYYHKRQNDFVTVAEFCHYYKMNEKDVRQLLD